MQNICLFLSIYLDLHAQIDVFADGVAIKEPGAECFRLLRKFLDGVLLVTPLISALCTSDKQACLVLCDYSSFP